MTVSISTIEAILQAKRTGENKGTIDSISIDSRSLQNNEKTLFFALKGPHFDAHNYLLDLIKQGVQTLVVTAIPHGLEGKATFLQVNNSLQALQQLATYYRGLFTIPVVGITGSNGKTIVKEWLNVLLNPDYNIIRSPKSYNSQVGVPLSILSIHDKHTLGIFEAGISKRNEMAKLEAIIQPTIGIITNIGSAHDEGFENKTQKAAEKLLLFQNAQLLIYQKNKTLETLLESNPKFNAITRFTWSYTDETAHVLVTKKTTTDTTIVQITTAQKSFELKIPFQDEASIENAINCLMLLLHFQYNETIIGQRMQWLYPIQMRLQLKTGCNNTTLIDDSYSADFQSLKIALDFLESQKQHKNKTLILSDILQSGLTNEALYTKVAQLITNHKINRVIGIGTTIEALQEQFENCLVYRNTTHFFEHFEHLNFQNETILIKGARHFQFEEIVASLEEKTHETILEVNLNALSHNLGYYKSKLQPTTKIMVMVKAFGYGNGGFEICKLLEHHKVDYLGVAFADEGISLKNAGINLPIMVLNPEISSFASIIQYKLEPEIYSLKGLQAFLALAEKKKVNHYPIHIKLDTGMHRLGFEEHHLETLIDVLSNNKYLSVKSILSHLATSDDITRPEYTHKQIKLFEKLSKIIIDKLDINPIRHILNSSGISNFPEAQYNMVRLGIGIYGVSNNKEEQKYLENVGTLQSIISQIRTVLCNESVGYGRRFVATRKMQIATIPIGYADGISRHWGNGAGYVTIKKQRAPIIGSICMDMLMVDVSDIPCKEGDIVTIFGQDPTVIAMATQLQTIPYEILTSISQRVKRVFFRE